MAEELNEKNKIRKEKTKLSRSEYRTIKNYNNEQMSEYLEKVYQRGWAIGYTTGKLAKEKEHVVEKFERYMEKDGEEEKPAVRYTCPNKECKKEFRAFENDPPTYCRQCGTKLSWSDVRAKAEDE